jgi:hypothetical protein
MIIYESTRAMAYVYLCTHKVTSKFYYGYREYNVTLNLPSTTDFPLYRTSSKVVGPNFDEYDWIIIAEFFTGLDAYDFEQELIYENWGNPLLLNKSCFYDKARFKCGKGVRKPRRKPVSKEHRRKLSEALTGKKRSSPTEETIQKRRDKMLGRILSDETKKKISFKNKGRLSWHKGRKKTKETIQRMHEGNKNRKPISEETRKNMSLAQTGLKRSRESIDKRLATMNSKSVEQLEEIRRKKSESLKLAWALRIAEKK